MGEQIRKDITVVMVAPMPGTEVREEYKRGFGVPTLEVPSPGENDPKGEGMAMAEAWAAATGGGRCRCGESRPSLRK